jgi:hypothetical protein
MVGGVARVDAHADATGEGFGGGHGLNIPALGPALRGEPENSRL